MKKSIVLLLLVSCLLLSSLSYCGKASGQSVIAPPIEWQSTMGGFKVAQTYDGGYILFGSGRVSQLNSFGEVEWTQTYSYEFHSGDQCSDGGFVLAGNTVLVKTDENGLIQWERNFEESGFLIGFRAVQQSSDGDYVLAGWRTPDGVNNDDFFSNKN
jgi:hypothetical protein